MTGTAFAAGSQDMLAADKLNALGLFS